MPEPFAREVFYYMNIFMQYFETSEFILGISLLTLGFSIETLDKTNPSRIQFVFKRTKELDQAIQFFWSNELRLEPKLFHYNQKNLKNRINNS